MKIYEVFDKRKYLPLLLIADEQESRIEEYIDKISMFVLDDGGVKAEISVCDNCGVPEIKSLAVLPDFRKKGYGRKLLNLFVKNIKKIFPPYKWEQATVRLPFRFIRNADL